MEEDIKVQVCRLCFSLISDKNFFSIKGSVKDMLQIITTDLDLDITCSPVMCNECSKSLQELFNFKTNFFESEEKIDSRISDKQHEKLNLKDIMNSSLNKRPKRKSKRENLKNNKLCRTCLETIDGRAFTPLSENADICLESMLNSCLPELDLNLTSDPVMCQACFGTLQKMRDFKLVCRKNENQIEAYSKKMCASIKKKVNLHSVLQFLFNTRSQFNIPDDVMTKREPEGQVKTEGKLDQGEERYEVKDCLQYVMVKMEPDEEEIGTEQEKTELESELFGAENRLEYVTVKMECTYGEDRVNRNEVAPRESCSLLNKTKEESVKGKTEDKSKSHSRSQTIRSSKRVKKKNEEKSMIHCAHCNFKTQHKYHLRRHLVVAHKQKHVEDYQKKFYQCEQCNFATKWNIDLTRHMLSHVKPEAYQCTRCPYSTNQNSQLIKHILFHVNADNMDKYSFLQLNKKT